MPIEVLMPALSPTMTEGNVAKWLKKEGDTIEAGDVIAEIETDKATMEVEAVDEGTLGKIVVKEGSENIAVNSVIALILEDGEDKKSLSNYKISKSEAVAEKPQEKVVQKAVGENQTIATNTANITTISPPPAPVATPAPVITNTGGRIIASPLAKRIANQEKIPLGNIAGTGTNNRITKQDVLNAQENGVSNIGQIIRNPVLEQEVPVNNIRKIIAERLCLSKQTIPHFYLNIECNIDKLLATRTEINNYVASEAGDNPPAYKLSVNDFVIKATALALKKVPTANSAWINGKIIEYTNVDVSVAVAIADGLITPIIFNADQKSLAVISTEMKDLASRARANKLTPEEFQGGGFSITNLGMYGIKNFQAIVNPPQSAILAIGAGEKRPICDGDKITTANIVCATLSSDHRIVDGAVGAEFLNAFKQYIENPTTLLL